MRASRTLRQRLGWPIAALAATLAAGTAGYATIWDWPIVDAFYMTATAVTAVGFGEVRPLTTGGRLFTIGVVAVGFGQIWYILSVIVGLGVEGELRGVWERRRMERRIGRASGHVLICGYGRVGRQIAAALQREGRAVGVIDTDAAVVRDAGEAGCLSVLGDATEDATLKGAGIERADGLVTAVANDADNVFVTLSARALRPDLPIVARANLDDAAPKLRRAGATQVVSPYAMAGRRMARLVLRPATVGLVESLFAGGEGDLLFEEVRVGDRSTLVGQEIAAVRANAAHGATLLAVYRDGTTLAPPPGDLALRAGDVVAAVGNAAQLRDFEERCEGEAS